MTRRASSRFRCSTAATPAPTWPAPPPNWDLDPDALVQRHAARDLPRRDDRLRAGFPVPVRPRSGAGAAATGDAAHARPRGQRRDRRRADRHLSARKSRRLAAARAHADAPVRSAARSARRCSRPATACASARSTPMRSRAWSATHEHPRARAGTADHGAGRAVARAGATSAWPAPARSMRRPRPWPTAWSATPDNAAVLELTLQGPTLQLLQPMRLAICGADVAARFEDAAGERTAIPGGRRVELPAGMLHLGAIRDGAARLARVCRRHRRAGGARQPQHRPARRLRRPRGPRAAPRRRAGAGSRSGRRMHAAPTMTTWWIDTDRPRPARARALSSLRRHPAARAARSDALAHRPAQQPPGAAAATAMRLPAPGGDVVSAAVAPGTLQLPPDGQPIVLLADAQTVGGYPRLGHVIAADLPRLAQWRPGDGCSSSRSMRPRPRRCCRRAARSTPACSTHSPTGMSEPTASPGIAARWSIA